MAETGNMAESGNMAETGNEQLTNETSPDASMITSGEDTQNNETMLSPTQGTKQNSNMNRNVLSWGILTNAIRLPSNMMSSGQQMPNDGNMMSGGVNGGNMMPGRVNDGNMMSGRATDGNMMSGTVNDVNMMSGRVRGQKPQNMAQRQPNNPIMM